MKRKYFISGVSMFAVVFMLCCGFGSVNCVAVVVTDGNSFYQMGDANKDSSIDIKDLVRVKRYLADTSQVFISAADVDQNGTVDAQDLISIRKYLLEVGTFDTSDTIWDSVIN